ncbi:12620_t:CDS:2 [Ambispora gerdemannii]|uniref:12620_t:CDS:1 n=1 Tax=Ambispora gerdemannii TaxID=144530 RepID=A0A9N9AZ03_9GLOM|nr:12620_t:CDS:2 [Ambispora gerdemannii]
MAKDLSDAEQKAVGYKSEVGLQTNSFSTTPKNNDNTIGKGGIIAIISVASLAVIGSLVAVKNKFNKKKSLQPPQLPILIKLSPS